MSVGGAAPEKFIKTPSGVRKLNPEWKEWKKHQDAASGASPHTAVPQMANADFALPVVTSIQDQQRHLQGSAAAESVTAAQEMLQDEDIAADIGVNPANAMDGLNQVFARYEVPMGLINKLMTLSDYQFMEFLVDDSGSMNAATDSKLPNGQQMTRWQEVHQRFGQMFEIFIHVPIPPAYIRFLNRPDVIEIKRNPGENPQAFFQRVMMLISQCFQKPPAGTTPAKERIAESLGRCQGQSVIRYFFGDGQPNGGAMAEKAITQMLIQRPNPQQNPFTFISCTNEDDAIEWMREAEEAAAYVSEVDNFEDEAREVLEDQGKAFPYTFGMWLICLICGAMNSHDLDALDEAAPMSLQTLNNIQGYQLSPQEYQYYFDSFLEAQGRKPVETPLDKLQKDYLPFWRQNFQQFLTAPMANQIEAVQAYHQAVATLKARGR